jgi:hypothetical protein
MAEPSELQLLVSAKYPQCKVVPIARKYFDETKGAKYVSMYAIPSSTLIGETAER